jgi:anaerobic ribonucleoside-triphosphate reductase activating protein
MEVLYFSHPQITVQDVPDEISLALSISGCKLKCHGCHSAFTWNEQYGKELTDKSMLDLLYKHKHISCVLFYGGEWKSNRLLELFQIVKSKNLKICLYTGLEFSKVPELIKDQVDYLKVGRYISNLGPINQKGSNQKIFSKKDNIFYDITYLLQK